MSAPNARNGPPERDDLDEAIHYARGGAAAKALPLLRELAARATDPAVRAEALRHEADLHRSRCDWEAAIACAHRSATEAGAAGSAELLADALNAEAAVHQSRGEYDAARPLLHRMLEVSQDARIRGIALQNLGFIAAMGAELTDAEAAFRQSASFFERAGYERGELISLINLGLVMLKQGEAAAAEVVLAEAVRRVRPTGEVELLAGAILNYADALAASGRLDEAADRASEALGQFLTIENRWRQIECLRLLGDIHDSRGDRDTAVRCWRQGQEIARQIDARAESEALRERLDRPAGSE